MRSIYKDIIKNFKSITSEPNDNKMREEYSIRLHQIKSAFVDFINNFLLVPNTILISFPVI